MRTEDWAPALRDRLTDPDDASALLEFFDRTAVDAYDYALERTADHAAAHRVCVQVYLDIFEMPTIVCCDDMSNRARIQILIHLRLERLSAPARRRIAFDRIRTPALHRRRNAHEHRRPRRPIVALPGEVTAG